MEPIEFLDSVAGYVRQGSESSADRPIRLATIDPAFNPLDDPYPGAKVIFEGEDEVSGKLYPIARGVMLLPGERVYMVPIGRTYLIAGHASSTDNQGFYQGDAVGVQFGGGSFIDSDAGLYVDGPGEFTGELTAAGRVVVNNVKVTRNAASAAGHASTGFGFVPGNPAMAFTKLFGAADTKIILTAYMTIWASSGTLPCQARLGVNMNSTNYEIDNISMNALNQRHKIGGNVEATGIPAGNYTVGVVWRVPAAGPTINTDSAQWISLRVEEVPV